MGYRIMLAGAFALLAAGCTVFSPYKVEGVPTQHIIMVDANGRLMDPTGSVKCHPQDVDKDNAAYNARRGDRVAAPTKHSWQPCNGEFNGLGMRSLPERDVAGYLHDMFESMDEFFATDPAANHRVVIIIHGGLDTNRGNLLRARDIAQHIREDHEYPIFINWQSNLFRSLAAHLFTVRHGDYVGPKSAPLFPLYFLTDIVGGYAHAPVIWVDQLENDVDRMRRRFTNHRTRVDNAYCTLRQDYLDFLGGRPGARPAVDVSKGPFKQTTREGSESFLRYTSTGLIPLKLYAKTIGQSWPTWTWLPARYLLSPILYGLGGPAWEEMERHATLGFHGPTEASTTPGYRAENEIGGIARFLRELQIKMNCPAPPQMPCDEKSWDVTLIGHSMGAIVVNHILRDFDDIPFRNIVYMAAASSVRDYEDSVFPYLEQHQATQVHHLMLHDFAEIRDQYGVVGPLELPPSGSLLVWIDNYFTRPPTLRDRTAGRFDNLMLFIGDTPLPVRDRIHVKTFGVGRKLTMTDPQHHGDFNDFDGEPHECVAVDVAPDGRLFFLDKPLPGCDKPGHENPCLMSLSESRRSRKSACIYGDKFWRPTFWKTEDTDRPTDRPACLLNAD